MAQLPVPGASLYYELYPATQVRGQLVLVNGHARPGSDLKSMAKKFAEQGFTTCIYDHRGVGDTVLKADFDFRDLVGDLHRLQATLLPGPCHVLGISMGGMIAMDLAATHSFDGCLILVSTSGRPKQVLTPESPWQADQESVYQKLSTYVSTSYRQGHEPLLRAMAKNMAAKIGDPDRLQAINQQRRALHQVRLEDKLAKIENPTLILHGSADQIIPYSEALYLQEQITAARIKAYENCGHLLLLEAYQMLMQDALEFILEHTE